MIEPDRNSDGDYRLVFNEEIRSNLIKLKNDGHIQSEV